MSKTLEQYVFSHVPNKKINKKKSKTIPEQSSDCELIVAKGTATTCVLGKLWPLTTLQSIDIITLANIV